MNIEFSTYLIPAAVAIYWVMKIFIAKSPIYTVHKLGAASLLTLAGALLTAAGLYSSNIPDDFAILALMTILISLFSPFYHLYIRKKTNISGIKPIDYILFLPALFLLFGHMFILISIPPDFEETTLIREIVNLKTAHNHVAVCKIAHVVFFVYYIIVPLMLVVDIFCTMINERRFNKILREWNPADTDTLKSKLHKSLFLDTLTALLITIFVLMPILHLQLWVINMLSIIFAGLLYFCGHICFNTKYCASKMYEDFCSQELIENPESRTRVEPAVSITSENVYEDIRQQSEGTTPIIPRTNIDITLEEAFPDRQEFESPMAETIKKDREEMLKSSEVEGFEDEISDNYIHDLKHPDQRLNEKQMIAKEDLKRIETEHLFLDSNLTLNKLADTLGTNRTYLTNAIRYYHHTNLAGYIKDLRIEYAMMLIDTRPITKVNLSEISMDCGYNNIATFYRDFASVVGIAPKQYFIFRRG